MKVLIEFLKYLLYSNINPFTNLEYNLNHIKFYEDIQNAKKTNNSIVLYQYYGLFVVFLLKAVHFIYLYLAELDEIDKLIHYAPVIWFDNNSGYPPFFAIYLNIIILYYLMFFSSDSECFIKSRKLIFEQTSKVNYHWPYHYHGKHCGEILKLFTEFFLFLSKITSYGFRG